MCGGLLAMGVGFQAHGLECGGRVVGWGGSSGIDPELTAGFGHHVTAIAAGGIYYAGLRADGTVALGQGNPDFMGAVPPTPDKLRGVKAIFGAKQLFVPNMFVIKIDGAVTGWGVNDDGQLNIPLAAQSGVRTMAANGGRVVVIKEDGSVFSWGRPRFGTTVADHNAFLATEIRPRNPVRVEVSSEYDFYLFADGTAAFVGIGPNTLRTVVESATGVLDIRVGQANDAGLLVSNYLPDCANRLYGQNSSGAAMIVLHCDVQAFAVGYDGFYGIRSDRTVSRYGYSSGTMEYFLDLQRVRAVDLSAIAGLALVDMTAQERVGEAWGAVFGLLAGLGDPAQPKADGRELDKALAALEGSVAEGLWTSEFTVDSVRGEVVFRELGKAVEHLNKAATNKAAGEGSDEFESALGMEVRSLLCAASVLAKSALEAAANGEGNENKLAEGVRAYQEAESLAESDRKNSAVKAMDHYGKAWKRAQEAVR